MAYDDYGNWQDDYSQYNNDWSYQNPWQPPQEEQKQEEQKQAPEPPPAPPPPRFDAGQQVGHDGRMSNGWNREQYRDAWMGSGVQDVNAAKAWLAQNGGVWLSDNGTVRTPFGETLDMLINARGSLAGQGPAQAGWGPAGGGSPAPAPAPVPSPALTVGPPITPAAAAPLPMPKWEDYLPPDNPATPPVDPEMEAREKALLDQLSSRMSQTLAVDPNDPILRNQVEAYGAAQERARRNYLSDVAESSSPYATGSMRNEQRMTAEKLGQNTAGFQAELMGRELMARRNEVQAALEQMGGLLTEDQRQRLQKELAGAENALRRYGIDVEAAGRNADRGQNDTHFWAELSQKDRLAALERELQSQQLANESGWRNRQLDQEASQWSDKLGFDTADRQSYWDAVRRGLL